MKKDNAGPGISFVVMPVEILRNKTLTPSEKILYCYLTLFKSGVCYQSNNKLAETTGLDASTVKRGLKKLSEMKFIFVEFVNNNSAMRRIYVIMENPKKLEYLAKKGLLVSGTTQRVEENKTPAIEETTPKELPPTARPRRSDYKTDEEYEKAFYHWNNVV